jgi:L-ascorbate metabolism protein UlaG (beta-lactamase superfamily)
MPTIQEFLCGGVRRVPRGPLPSTSPLEAWNTKPETGLRATWLGHATVLLELDGLRVLTDPVWGLRLAVALAAKAVPAGAGAARALPRVDAVVISHDHYDHLDYPTILELAKRDVPFVTSLGVGAHLEAWGVRPERIHELDWWESYALPKSALTVTAVPSQHISRRSLNDRNATLWSSGRDVRSPCGVLQRDTGLTPEYSKIRERLGPFDLVLTEVGAFHPATSTSDRRTRCVLCSSGGGPFLSDSLGNVQPRAPRVDQPAEELLRLGGAQLVMPRSARPWATSRVETVHPWWRGVDTVPSAQRKEEAAPEELPPKCPGPWTGVS